MKETQQTQPTRPCQAAMSFAAAQAMGASWAYLGPPGTLLLSHRALDQPVCAASLPQLLLLLQQRLPQELLG